MYLGHRSYQNIKGIAVATAIYISIVAALALLLPRNDRTYAESFASWFFGIPTGLFAWATLEWLGSKLLGLSFWRRLPSILRILLLVIIVVAVIVTLVVGLELIRGDTL